MIQRELLPIRNAATRSSEIEVRRRKGVLFFFVGLLFLVSYGNATNLSLADPSIPSVSPPSASHCQELLQGARQRRSAIEARIQEIMRTEGSLRSQDPKLAPEVRALRKRQQELDREISESIQRLEKAGKDSL